MATLNLKHIPCPKGDTCTAFKCIFGHAREKQSAPLETSSTQQSTESPSNVQADQTLPRKRLKVDDNGTASSAQSSPKIKSPAPSKVNPNPNMNEHLAEPAAIRLKTSSRPVSPPPLRKPSAKATPPPTPTTRNTATSSKSKAPETLNPRLLKSAPAKHDVRLKLLKMLHGEMQRLNQELRVAVTSDASVQKLLLTDQQLIHKALDEEEKTATERKSVYSNIMKHAIMRYKRMKLSDWKDAEAKRVLLAEDAAAGKSKADEPVDLETGLTPAQEVHLLKHLYTPIATLSQYGYVPEMIASEDIEAARKGLEAAKGWEECDRCRQRFQVFPGRREEDGALTSGGKCVFHPGRTYLPPKDPLDSAWKQKVYRCCGEHVGDSAGCDSRDHHVFKVADPKRLAAVWDFARTPENEGAPRERAVAFDCEMGYTTYGMEVIRVTATSWPDGSVLLDVLVRPLGEILDLNSRYSGVWPEDMAQASPLNVQAPSMSSNPKGPDPANGNMTIVSSPEVARDLFFSLLAPTTPLIGHGLENDLNAMRVIHPVVADTILLYPHKLGLPRRLGLKPLALQYLNKRIQVEDTASHEGPRGHDSAEDARTSGELLRFKVKEKWKDMLREGWKVQDDDFVDPTGNHVATR